MSVRVLRPCSSARQLQALARTRRHTSPLPFVASQPLHLATALHIVQSQQQQRFASSSAGPQGDDKLVKELPSGHREVLDTLAKVRARRNTFRSYRDNGVFSLSWFSAPMNWWHFYQLNRPQHTQVDLEEFLVGARHALETTLSAMYSTEFKDFCDREKRAPGKMEPDCAAAELLHNSMESKGLAAFKIFATRATFLVELQQLEVHEVYLESVNYYRVPKHKTTNASGAHLLGVPMDERLGLRVVFDITEHVKVTTPGADNPKVKQMRHETVYEFDSSVTTPEDMNWVIEPLEETV